MCGRFVAASPPEEIARYFGATEVSEQALEPSWNVAPTNRVYTVTEDGSARRVAPFHWGLVPIWAKDPSAGSKMINARAETLADKNAFKHAFRKRRCIIPADGFYEWKKVPGQKRKQPVYIHRPDGEPMAFAGLWEEWRGPDRNASEPLRSCTIITGLPNDAVAAIHDRMPVMLPPSAWDTWLDPEMQDLDVLDKLLVPAPAKLTVFHPVSTEVNNVRNEGEQLAAEVDPDDEAGAQDQRQLL